jgi:hypothetical protein
MKKGKSLKVRKSKKDKIIVEKIGENEVVSEEEKIDEEEKFDEEEKNEEMEEDIKEIENVLDNFVLENCDDDKIYHHDETEFNENNLKKRRFTVK